MEPMPVTSLTDQVGSRLSPYKLEQILMKTETTGGPWPGEHRAVQSQASHRCRVTTGGRGEKNIILHLKTKNLYFRIAGWLAGRVKIFDFPGRISARGI